MRKLCPASRPVGVATRRIRLSIPHSRMRPNGRFTTRATRETGGYSIVGGAAPGRGSATARGAGAPDAIGRSRT